MIAHAIATILLAALSVLFAWAIFRTLKKPMPAALVPSLVAVSVIAYGIYSEYTWASRTLSQLPDSMEVVHEIKSQSMFSPWAYLIPRTDRLSVVDSLAIKRNPDLPQMAIIELLLLQRFNPVISTQQLIDCDQARRADLPAGQTFDESGLPRDVQWQSLDDDHQMLDVVCTS